MGDKKNKKEKQSDHPLDKWPPSKKEEDDPKIDRLKPRNTSYVDPIEDLEHTDAPVYDIFDKEEDKDYSKYEEDDKKEENEKDGK